MGSLPRGVLLHRVKEKDKDKRLARETLVSLARTCHLQGDAEAARVILETLIARVSGTLHQKLTGWNVPPADNEDIMRHLIVGLCGCWLNTDAAEEFWECNFTTPFQLRTLTLIQGFFPKAIRALSLQEVYNDGDDTGTQKDIPDPDWEKPFKAMMQYTTERAALAALSRHNAVWGQVLYQKFGAGYSEEEIAARYGVSSRTIRNWTTSAQAFLLSQISSLAQSNKEDC